MSETTGKQCQHCGGYHVAKCPLIKAIEYHPDGEVKRVEFMTPADYAMPMPYIPSWPAAPNPYPPGAPFVPPYVVTCGTKP